MVEYKDTVIQVDGDHYIANGNNVIHVDDVFVVRDVDGTVYEFDDLHSALLFARQL